MLSKSDKKYFEDWCKGVRGEDNLVSVPNNVDIEDMMDRDIPQGGWRIVSTPRFMEELNELSQDVRECVVANISVMKYARYPISMGRTDDWVNICEIGGGKSIVYDFQSRYGKITLYWIGGGPQDILHIVTPIFKPDEEYDGYDYMVKRLRENGGDSLELRDMREMLRDVRNGVEQ